MGKVLLFKLQATIQICLFELDRPLNNPLYTYHFKSVILTHMCLMSSVKLVKFDAVKAGRKNISRFLTLLKWKNPVYDSPSLVLQEKSALIETLLILTVK